MDNVSNIKASHFVSWLAAFAHGTRMMNRVCHEEMGFGLTQMRILIFAAAYPDTSMSDIGRSLALRRSTITAAVDNLAAAGLIERIVDQRDSRIVRARVTKKAYGFLREDPLVADCILAFSRQWVLPNKIDDLKQVLFSGSVHSDSLFLGREFYAYDEMCSRLGLDRSQESTRVLLNLVYYAERVVYCYNRVQLLGKSYGLGTNTGLVLAYLQQAGGKAPLNMLRNDLKLESGEVTVCLDKLEKRGRIKRTTDKKDRRCVHVRITKSGASVVNQVLTDVMGCMEETFPGLLEHSASDYLVVS